MSVLYLVGSIAAETSGKTFDKLNYHKNNIHPRQVLLIVFSVMSVMTFLYILVFQRQVPHITLATAAVLGAIALFSFIGNVFDELSLQKNDISLREPLVDFEPIATGLLAYLLFPEERKLPILIAFILGTFVVYWGVHRRKLRKAETRGLVYLLVAIAAYSIVPIFYKQALTELAPAYIAFFRLVSITLLASLFFRPSRLKKISGSMFRYSILSGTCYAIGAIVSLYAIQTYGVVLTMLFLMLGPALNYLSGYFILHEKVRKGEVLASLMLAVIVAVAAFVR